MNMPINGRGQPTARFTPRTGDEGTIRIDCDRDLSVWYEITLTRATLELMLEALDAAEMDILEAQDEDRRGESCERK